MTKEEKERKLKLIALIMLVETEKLRRQLPKTIPGCIKFATEMIWWANQFRIIKAMPYPKLKSGGVLICGK